MHPSRVPLLLALAAAAAAPFSAEASVTNTARVTLNPSFSGGLGPVDEIVEHAGLAQVSRSTTGGLNSAAEGSTVVVYGRAEVRGSASGSINASETGTFRDMITLSAPGVPSGTTGNLTYSVRVSGVVEATAGSSATSWRLTTDLGGGASDIRRSGTAYSPDIFGPPYVGDSFGTYSATVQVRFGFPSPLLVSGEATAGAANSSNGPGAARTAQPVVVEWNGITSITINGSPVAGVVVTSESGTDWSVPYVPPCLGDFNADGGVDGDDVIAFFAAWDSSNAAADITGDGGVDGDDVIAFFEHWDAGC